MSYVHIDNLYKDQTILMFRECYAMEKIHGTSAHISYTPSRPLPTNESVVVPAEVKFFSGGASHLEFVVLFNKDELLERFSQMTAPVTVYGEAYGGKMQGMRDTYGDKLRFVAFEVKIGDSWLNVFKAEQFARLHGFDFVHFVKCSTDIDALNAQRDSMSVQAIKNGCGVGHMREGIVLHPLEEFTLNNGGRVIAKHKRDEFRETKTARKVDKNAILELQSARAVADEWVTEERLNHVLDATGLELKIENTGAVIKAMTDDIFREAGVEVEGKKANKEIGRSTALMFKRRFNVI